MTCVHRETLHKPSVDTLKVLSSPVKRRNRLREERARKRSEGKNAVYDEENLDPNISNFTVPDYWVFNHDHNDKDESTPSPLQTASCSLNEPSHLPMDIDVNTKDASTQTDSIDIVDSSLVRPQNSEEKATQTSVAEESSTQTSSTEKIDTCTQTPAHSFFFKNMKTEEQLTCLTGINSFDLFNGLCSAVDKYNIGQKNRVVNLKDRILLTLMKLKLNSSYTFLSVCFDVDRRTCSRYFWSIIPILRIILKNFIICPSREQIRDNLPYSFRSFPTTIFILDCTEIPVCSPTCIRCRTQTWSQYKKRHTIKVLIGVTSCGMIVYNGPCYGGKASDNFLFSTSNLLERCQPGDSIMVDKEFRIEEECKLKGVNLIRPAFKENNEQLGYEDCEHSRMVASARVHVERVMERLKNF